MPYAFTAEGFNKFSEDIIKAEGDQATVTTLLADMGGTITEAIAKDIANTSKVETVSAENERLKKANMDLFLRIGTPAEPEKKILEDQQQNIPATSRYMKSYFESLDKK